MSNQTYITIEGNEAAAHIAYRTNDVIAIYPITPSSGMGEMADAWAAAGLKNIWGQVPTVVEMQSEGGAAGAVHGSLQTGSKTTTFTASQGLLLMIPNMYKIAGELTSAVFHISARSLAAQGLSIFGDHSDVMACRQTGWGMVFGNDPQEVMDLAMVCEAASLASRVPFLNIFDGFRTSHEVQKIVPLSDGQIREMVDERLVDEHRSRALTPDNPRIRGTAQNPDVYFQSRETVNPFYEAVPGIVQDTMDKLASLTGRQYKLFDYVGAPDAEHVVVMMGSGACAAEETVEHLNALGAKLGLIKVRLYRPFSVEHFWDAIPATTKGIAVLDRTKEPGSAGEPLYKDVLTALGEGVLAGRLAGLPKVIGGRYGLSSKEFTPAMVKAVFDELAKDSPKNRFTVGIHDDLSGTSLDFDPSFQTETPEVTRAVFWGLGADGTVGANKNSIKIIGEETDNYAQGYFVYDSKKSGSMTVSHLRFGPKPIKSTYLVQSAQFVACHQFGLLFRYPVLNVAAEGATFLLNSPYKPDEVWDKLPADVQREIIAKKLKFYMMDGYAVARETGMGSRINTIMQTAFFALSGILPREEAIEKIRNTIKKTYGARGEAVVRRNFAAVDQSLAHLFEVQVPDQATSKLEMRRAVPCNAPSFVKQITAELILGRGDLIPVSQLPCDGTFPTATSQWEKRDISLEAPVWEPDICTQCGKCSLVCPHAVIRAKVMNGEAAAQAPEGFRMTKPRFRVADDAKFTIQVSVQDCTGCGLCIEVCPGKDKTNASRKALNFKLIDDMNPSEKGDWDYFLSIPDTPYTADPVSYHTVKNLMLKRPLFEFNGGCGGCGETPYIGMLTRLFGDRMVIANATGCSSIYGGNLPTTPYCKDEHGRGPAWCNSLFEDNAEFGFGYRLSLDSLRTKATLALEAMNGSVDPALKETLLKPAKHVLGGVDGKRECAEKLRARLLAIGTEDAIRTASLLDALIEKSVWIIGGDGWAYDIGFGGLDHVLASGADVNVLVLDTEVYSNTGGQASKATARGAVAKFAAGGKPRPKKDLGRIAMTYGNIYVGTIAFGANDQHALKTLLEAEAYEGPSLVIAYSHCIAHGIDMRKGLRQQKLAVDSGHFPLYRYNPDLVEQGQNPFTLDSRKPSIPLRDYIYTETRYSMLAQADPASAARLLELAQKDVLERWATYEKMAGKGAESR